ncbi:MAG TPA: ATP-dependent DNA helicase [Candidatus Saccharimonadales bacterium]
MGKYEEALRGLNDAQKLAVTTTEGPVLVIAGPGTGKTQLLTTRIAHILATTDTLPQNILCLTFTESAAHTMRERLANMIGQAAYDVAISTYHGFGSDLIRRFPDYFTSDSNLRPIDDLGIDRIFREIIAGLPYGNPLKHSDSYLGDIKSLVSDAKRGLLTPDDLRQVAQHNLQFIAKASPVVSDTLSGLIRVTKKDIPLFAQVSERLQKFAADDTPLSGSMPLAHLLLNELDESLSEAARTDKTTPLTKWKNAWLARDTSGKMVLEGEKTNQKILAAADVYEQYLAGLQAHGMFDYDDMILRAVHALETNDDLRFTLQERYLYILLDEFQDTNGAQLRIVELLTDNPINEGRPNILAVGDDDQAIYAFQGANYSHMLQFKRLYQDVLAVPLVQNYRSHGDILHTARGVAEQIEERLHHHFPAVEKTLTAQNKQLPARAVVERREAASDVMQFAWTAQQIKKLIDDGMQPSEIAVLAPQHKYLEPLVPFLQKAGVPVRYEKRENILENPGINQLLRMAELCLALQDSDVQRSNALWAEVLSFDFWNLDTSTIWQLSWQTTDEDESWTNTLLADEQLKPIALFFIRLGQMAQMSTLETIVDHLVGSEPLDLKETGYETFTSPYYRYYFGGTEAQLSIFDQESTSQAEFWNLLTDLIVLRARLREFKLDGDEPLYIRDLVDFVAAHQAAEIKILNTSPYATANDAVQLMTAFKAKGMEFDAVFVLAVNDEAWGASSRRRGNFIALPQNLQHIRYAGATNDERLRLFYVAVTRAKTHLYLLNYVQSYTGKSLSRLRYLSEQTDGEVVLSPLLPQGSQLVASAESSVATPTTELSAYWQQRHEAALSAGDMQALLQDRLSHFQLSPTHINDFTDVMYCGPTAFFMRTILRFPVAPRPEVHFGNAMHETLEWMHQVTKKDGLLPSLTAVHRTFEQRLRAKRMNTNDTTLFLERGHAALTVYMAQRAHTFGPDNIAEYSFRSEGVFIGDAHLTGKIDKLIIDKEKKSITIVDYKTGKSYSSWKRDAKLHKYRLQLYMYKALVEGSHTFAGYTVKDAYLEFVEPDDNGHIQELPIDFNDDEYARVRQLAERAWRRIKALDLPDITQYKPDLSGIESFENDLLK